MADLIAKDLTRTGRFLAVDISKVRQPSYPEVTAPAYATWRSAGAGALVSGFVQARPDGRLTVGCYLYDVQSGRELTRTGFLIAPADWRRAAHKCSDAIYQKVTGQPGLFQTRIAYVEESGPGPARTRRLAVQDLDLAEHRYLTSGETIVLTPAWSPKGDTLAYVSLADGQPQVRLMSATGEEDRALMPDGGITFAPRFSPDGRRLLFSRSVAGNTDIHVFDLQSGLQQQLTRTPGTDTSASFSPDGRRITFESDRSGTQQIYVMNADGTDQRRISFGGGSHASPRWAPDGELIAFTRIDGPRRRVGVVDASGANPRMLTDGPADEAPTWGASSEHILFQRQADGRSQLFIVALRSGEIEPVTTPQEATDAAWSRPQE
jgi:TolB protein